jgi:hypothetical protein
LFLRSKIHFLNNKKKEKKEAELSLCIYKELPLFPVAKSFYLYALCSKNKIFVFNSFYLLALVFFPRKRKTPDDRESSGRSSAERTALARKKKNSHLSAGRGFLGNQKEKK